ncbi:MAG TPA: hypothetical protein DCL95_14350 [Rhodospirillaceae bacterium]|jgi:carbon monoxide dehydrogenase subunit G|nr:hypothetical protein [Rhodospirillaceae bacterium]MAX64085.1 hypothetical protein [Rhodospirillaceae bacterium]MBB57343.1 hypothetical protein [Rhodospirillaceae bacterium]HAE00595.1 hypothetical protein [Rhodospirillaceae bacterium]HAJ21212.1 hypothetical protein [Rhodospirillaceae bacterium]|tara:strand:- start:11930 stop:12391 length:462 start_codon:yes stop_codon:yes gene_type:complete
MQIEQSFTVNAPRSRVWTLIRDPEQMITCVPGCDSIEETGPDTYKAAVVVSVGPIKARFSMTIKVIEETVMEYVRTESKGEEGSRASVVQAISDMRLTDTPEGGTEIHYSSTVEISGRLGRYGSGMMKKIATKLAAKFEDSFRTMAETQEEVC